MADIKITELSSSGVVPSSSYTIIVDPVLNQTMRLDLVALGQSITASYAYTSSKATQVAYTVNPTATSSVNVVLGVNEGGYHKAFLDSGLMYDLATDSLTVGAVAANSFTGSLIGTASYAETASFAPMALTTSYYFGNAESASYVQVAQSASYYIGTVDTASYVKVAQSASYVALSQTASYYAGVTSTTASYSVSASIAKTIGGTILTWAGPFSNPTLGVLNASNVTYTGVAAYSTDKVALLTGTNQHGELNFQIASIDWTRNMDIIAGCFAGGTADGIGMLIGSNGNVGYLQSPGSTNGLYAQYLTFTDNSKMYVNGTQTGGTVSQPFDGSNSWYEYRLELRKYSTTRYLYFKINGVLFNAIDVTNWTAGGNWISIQAGTGTQGTGHYVNEVTLRYV